MSGAMERVGAGSERSGPPRDSPPTVRLELTGDADTDAYVTDVYTGARKPVPVTGVPLVDVGGDLINETLTPFTTVPRNKDGSENWTAYGAGVVGGALGLLDLVDSALDYGVAILLAPFAQMMELPAARITDLHIGIPHAHAHPPSFVPPAPPIPLPSLGMLTASGAINVFVGGLPAMRAGDIGLAPTCCSAAPVVLIVTGSSSVFIGGGRAARMGDLTIVCNPIFAALLKMQMAAAAIAVAGAVAGFVGSAAQGQWEQAIVSAAQATVDLARDAIKALVGTDPAIPPVTPSVMGAIASGAPTVMIGGLPVPPSDLLLPMLKGEVGSQPKRNKNQADVEADPEEPRRNRGGFCEC